jgi:acetyl esterase
MPLDPHVKRLLHMLAINGAANPSRMTVEARRQAFLKLMSFSDRNVAIGGVEDRAIPGPDGLIRMRLYTPVEPVSDELPGLVYFHGGGLVAGSLDSHEGLCRALVNETGFRVVAVDYRLAPEHKFPAAIVDSYAATVWVVKHAAELGIDRNRIAVCGDSAGGVLAITVCQLCKRVQGVNLAAQLLLCPITDFAAETKSRSTFAKGHLLDKIIMDRDLECYIPAGIDRTNPSISPLRAADFGSLPPAYIHTAEFDPLRDEGRAYADQLALAGVKASYTCHPGMIHLFYGMTSVLPYARIAIKRIGAELRAALG